MALNFLRRLGKQEKQPDSAQQDYVSLQDAIVQVKKDLSHTRTLFDLTDNFDLIESYIHQINALTARYNFLIKEAKKQEKCVKEYVTTSQIKE